MFNISNLLTKVVFSLNQPALIDLLKQLKLTKMGEEKISLIEVDKQLELRIEILHPPPHYHLQSLENNSVGRKVV